MLLPRLYGGVKENSFKNHINFLVLDYYLNFHQLDRNPKPVIVVTSEIVESIKIQLLALRYIKREVEEYETDKELKPSRFLKLTEKGEQIMYQLNAIKKLPRIK